MASKANTDRISPVDLQAGQVYETLLGERVEIVDDTGSGMACLELHFPERDNAQTQHMTRYGFADAANYEGYTLIREADEDTDTDTDDSMPGEWTGTPRCPVCARFMTCDTDGAGMPWSRCSRLGCNGMYSTKELVTQGHFVPGE